MLRTRLFLNLLPFVAILLATGVYAMVLFSRLAANVNITVTDNYRSVLAAQAMSLALAGMEREVPWVFERERTSRSTAFAAHQKRFEENLALHLQNVILPRDKEFSQQLATNYHAFQQAMAQPRCWPTRW